MAIQPVSRVHVFAGILVALTMVSCAAGDGGFGPANVVIEKTYNYADWATAFDADNDGDNDLATADYGPDEFLYFFRNMGNGSFEEPITVSRNMSGGGCVVADDVNGDGYLDLLYVSLENNAVGLAINQDGGASWAPAKTVVTMLGPNTITVDEVNGQKVLVVAGGNAQYGGATGQNMVGIYSMPDFTLVQMLTGQAYKYGCIEAVVGDLNNDTVADILWASGSMAGVYFGASDGTFNTQAVILSSEEVYANGAEIVDLDGDSVKDALWSSGIGPARIAYAKSDGNGGFSSAVDITSAECNQPCKSLFLWLALYYPDGATVPDIMTVNWSGDEVLRIRNNGGGDFGEPITVNPNPLLPNGASSIEMTDINGDGKDDIVVACSNFGPANVVWFANEE